MKEMLVQTNCWIPQIVKVEDGYIINLLSPNFKRMETYVFKNFGDVIEFLEDQFNITIKE